MATAGGLVFQGTADGRLVAYDAANGAQLWEAPLGNGVVAAPMTYEIDGRQYVSIAVGWGGSFGQTTRVTDRNSPGTVYTFVMGGEAKYPEITHFLQGPLVSGVPYDPRDAPEGEKLYVSNCAVCHGWPGVEKGGNIPNLAYADADKIANLETVVLSTMLAQKGMPCFAGKLTPDDVAKIKAFIMGMADLIRPKP